MKILAFILLVGSICRLLGSLGLLQTGNIDISMNMEPQIINPNILEKIAKFIMATDSFIGILCAIFILFFI